MVTIREWLTKNKSKYANDRKGWVKGCVENLDVSTKAVQNKAAGIWPARGGTKRENPLKGLISSVGKDMIITGFVKPVNLTNKDVMGAEDFITGIDIVRQIMDFLNTIVKDGYIEDSKLRVKFEIGISKWNEVKRLPIWEDRVFVYTTPTGTKATVWSSKKGIELARKTISMARYEL